MTADQSPESQPPETQTAPPPVPAAPANIERRLTPADVHNVRFNRGSMLRPGYVDAEVDRVMSRLAEELGRLIAEKAELRDQVRALQAQLQDVDATPAPVPPSEQAVRILATAQQTADTYVAEAEEFSRQVTAEAKAEYEQLVRDARENAGAIIQAAQEAAGRITAAAPGEAGAEAKTYEELQEQVAYLKAFGQATRTQLRSYLEALLEDVEREWGRANPAALPQGTALADVTAAPAQRSGPEIVADDTPLAFFANRAVEALPEDGAAEFDAPEALPAGRGSGTRAAKRTGSRTAS
jgi:DivIVA domain-containing protein